MHKQSMDLKENHVVFQNLEIEEPQQLQACVPSQCLLPAIFCYLPHSLSLNLRSFLSATFLLPNGSLQLALCIPVMFPSYPLKPL